MSDNARQTDTDKYPIRPFRFEAPEADLTDLRRRIRATRWLERETVEDARPIARAWVVLMKRLGYTKFAAQGGDWGAVITERMGVHAVPELLGIHTNMPGGVPADIDAAAFADAPAPAGLSADEKLAYERLQFVYQRGIAYGFQMGLPHRCAPSDRRSGARAFCDSCDHCLREACQEGACGPIARDAANQAVEMAGHNAARLAGGRQYRDPRVAPRRVRNRHAAFIGGQRADAALSFRIERGGKHRIAAGRPHLTKPWRASGLDARAFGGPLVLRRRVQVAQPERTVRALAHLQLEHDVAFRVDLV